MDPHVPNVTSLCLQYMKHDPNYDHDSDEEQMETEDSEFSDQGRWTACLRESRAQRPEQGEQATAGLPGWMLLFSSCEEGNAVILLPALLNSPDQKYLGKKLVCTQHIDSDVTAGVRVFILYQVL